MSQFIKNFQKEHGLVADGIIGKQTLLKMKDVLKIPTIEATAHFVGNTFHETGGFNRFEENLNYSESGLKSTFAKYYSDPKLAKTEARKPELIANRVYGGRMGNTQAGDGWKFRGRGALQTTGRTNYTLLGKFLGVDLLTNPDLVATKYVLQSAVFYFESNKLWKLASTVTPESIRKVRKAVNGGSIGLSAVTELVNKFYKLMIN